MIFWREGLGNNDGPDKLKKCRERMILYTHTFMSGTCNKIPFYNFAEVYDQDIASSSRVPSN